MDPNLDARITLLEQKIDKIYISVEKTRKYFLWTLVAGLVGFLVPLIGLAFVIPSFLSSYVGSINSASSLIQ